MALVKVLVATVVALGITPKPTEIHQYTVSNLETTTQVVEEGERFYPSHYELLQQNIIIITKKGEEAVQRRYEEEVKRKQMEAKRKGQTVFLTNFYPGDSLSTTEKTSTGHYMKDFGTNKHGMKTYNGRVVIGAATNLCLNTNTGACAKYNSLPKGYSVYDLYDEVEINFNGEWLPAVVLSSCGACFWDREYQTVDVLVDKNKGRFGKIVGGIR